MSKGGKFNVITGDKPNDIVTVKCLTKAGVLAGSCDLHTFDATREALDEQGHLDLVDNQGLALRVYQQHVIALIHIATEPKRSSLILP